MTKQNFVQSANGSQYWYDGDRLVRVKDKDGSERFYSYDPKPHLEYCRLKDGEEWFGHDGLSAKPDEGNR